MGKIIFIPTVAVTDFTPETRGDASTDKRKEQFFLAVVPVAKLPFDRLPLDANLRRANVKSKMVKEIYETLVNQPGELLKLNSGIVIIAEKAYYKYDAVFNPTGVMVEMLSELHGVANGAHTLAAIQMASKENVDLWDAHINIRISVGVTDESVVKTVVALNKSERVDKRSILHKQGRLDFIKESLEALGLTNITYYQNEAISEGRREDTRQNVAHALKMILGLDIKRSNPLKNQHPTFIAGGSNIMEEHALRRAEELILDFFPTLVRIEKLLYKKIGADIRKLPGVKEAKSFDKHALTVDGTSFPFEIHSAYVYPVIAAFRAFIEDDKWVIPVDDMLESIVSTLWKEYASFLRKEWDRDNRSLGGILRGATIWISLYNVAYKIHNDYLRSKLNEKDTEKNGVVPIKTAEVALKKKR